MKYPQRFDRLFHKLGTSNESDFTTATLAGFKLIFIPLATLQDKTATKEQKEYAVARDVLTEIIALGGYLGITKAFKTYATAPLCKKYYKKKAELIEAGKIEGLDKSKVSKQDLDTLKNINSKDLKEVASDINYREAGKKVATPEQTKSFEKLENAVKRINEAWPDNAREAKTWAGKKFQGFKDLFSSKLKLSSPADLYKDTRVSLSHVVICTLALTFIPYVCNLIITPVMEQYKKRQGKNKQELTPAKKLDAYPSHHAKLNEVKKPQNPQENVNFGNYYNNPTSRTLGNMRVGS